MMMMMMMMVVVMVVVVVVVVVMMMMMMAYYCSFLGKIVESKITSEVMAKDEPACEYASYVVTCKFH